MYIGKNVSKQKKAQFYVGRWIMKEIENLETNMKKSTETFKEEENIEEAENSKYLGQIISKDGTNIKNIYIYIKLCKQRKRFGK